MSTLQKTSESEKQLIKRMFAKGCTEDEFSLLLHMSKKYDLDILTKELWCVKYGSKPGRIFTGRDGFLSIAHKSGKLDGMKAGTFERDNTIFGYCEVFRVDMKNAFYVEVSLNEYKQQSKIWNEKPLTMIQKVAESQCLRRAFNVNGIYSPEEFKDIPKGQEIKSNGVKEKEIVIEVQEPLSIEEELKANKKAVWDLMLEKKVNLDQLEEIGKNLYNLDKLNGINSLQCKGLIQKLNDMG